MGEPDGMGAGNGAGGLRLNFTIRDAYIFYGNIIFLYFKGHEDAEMKGSRSLMSI